MYREASSIFWSMSLMSISILNLWGSLNLMEKKESVLWELELFSEVSMTVNFSLYWDWMSYLFFSVVAYISAFVVYYSQSYMSQDKNIERFLQLVMLFVLSMFFLVFSLNFISILIGWDGLGLVSYALVIYYQNNKSNSAGMITALSNRVGDAAILLSIGLFLEGGSWNFMMMYASEISWSASVLIILAAMTKSAQMPFSAWLPAAMAAPTPVSALVHSSTLVTAGIYLLIRFYPILELWESLWFLYLLGSLTTLMSSLSANMESDLKKIVALSTLSQLGIMVWSLGMGLPSLAFFHLITHAMFKALLFLCSGKIIHESLNTQDSRSMGSLARSLPFTSACLNLANLALCGFPFLAGFYSKDKLVEESLMKDLGGLSLIFIVFSIGLSVVYSVRFTFLSMINWSSLPSLSSMGEKDFKMKVAKYGLSSMAIISGCGLSWLIFPEVSLILLPWKFKFLVLTVTCLGGMTGLSMSFSSLNMMKLSKLESLFWGILQMWFLPLLSGSKLGELGLKLSKQSGYLDAGWWEEMGGQGMYFSILENSGSISVWQMNSFKVFLSLFLGSVVIFLAMFLSSL